MMEVPTGTEAFDWKVPKEWNIEDAYIVGPDGSRVVSFKDSNLHVVGYSVPIDREMPLNELQSHLHSLPDQPEAIPYVTSYYKETWGFCLTHRVREKLRDGLYRVVIKSRLEPGCLTYGEILIPGKSEKEIFFSTYVCHPSMGNNETSGPSLATFLAKYVKSLGDRRYTYRFIFIPETIGSITYLSRNLARLKENVVAGFNITCVGDDGDYSYLPSRMECSLADRIAIHVLKNLKPNFKKYSFLDRGSDERQYCSPGIDLPVASIMRTKYGAYAEYHTSLDSLDFICAKGFHGAYEVYTKCIAGLEGNLTYTPKVLCEPQLGRRGLYPSVSNLESHKIVINMLNVLAYCDGKTDLLSIADKIGIPVWEAAEIARKFHAEGIFAVTDSV